MLLLLWSYATVVVLGRKSETILPNKIVRRFLFFGVFFIVSDFVRTRTTQDCDGPLARFSLVIDVLGSSLVGPFLQRRVIANCNIMIMVFNPAIALARIIH